MRIENKFLKVEIDEPGSVYRGTRFDWTAFIRQVTLDNRIGFCICEVLGGEDVSRLGAGLCNEFGIFQAVGYDDCPIGGQFPKIGVGLLIRDTDEPYRFFRPYALAPASVTWDLLATDAAQFSSVLGMARGYSSSLTKVVSLRENQLVVEYALENSGECEIRTNEYCHNFLAINDERISRDYELGVSFTVQTELFGEIVNPGNVVRVHSSGFGWNAAPDAPFFFSRLGTPAEPGLIWTLRHRKLAAQVSESVWPLPSSMNLWGTGHVVSPEVFVEIDLMPGETMRWSRRFTFSG